MKIAARDTQSVAKASLQPPPLRQSAWPAVLVGSHTPTRVYSHKPIRRTTSTHQHSYNMTHTTAHHAPRDLWTRFVESAVHVVEKLCPPLERSLSWDFSDRNLLAFEEDCEQPVVGRATVLQLPRVRDIHEEMGDFLPHTATAA